MNLLALDTATPLLVLGVRSGSQLYTRTLQPERTHGEALLESLAALLEEAKLEKRELSAVVVGSGPGSFTGTRVGWAAGLGMAEGLGIPAVSVPTLDALGWEDRDSGRSCLAVLDARRGKFYTGVYLKGELQGGYRDLAPAESGELPRRVIGPHALDFIQAAGGEGWQAVETANWARGLLDIGAEKLQGGNHVRPGEGPLYLRPSVD